MQKKFRLIDTKPNIYFNFMYRKGELINKARYWKKAIVAKNKNIGMHLLGN